MANRGEFLTPVETPTGKVLVEIQSSNSLIKELKGGVRESIEALEREAAENRATRNLVRWFIGLVATGLISLSTFLVSTSIRSEERLNHLHSRLEEHVADPSHRVVREVASDLKALSVEVQEARRATESTLEEIKGKLERKRR